MNKHEIFALGSFLCEWDEEKSFEDNLKLLIDEDEAITIWEPFEYHAPEYVKEQIENMKESVERNFGDNK